MKDVRENEAGTDGRWLVRLRAFAIAGQVATIVAAVALTRAVLPLGALAAVIAAEVLFEVGCALFERRTQGESPVAFRRRIAALMAVDIVFLTALLYLTGGPMNPFNFLYLVHIALAAVVVGAAYAWGLAALSAGCFGVLFWFHRPLALAGTSADSMELHMEGMWVGFAVAAIFIVAFVNRVRRELEESDAQLAAAREKMFRNEKLASLATLAAGAAHELGTPLSTIAVVAKELDRHLERAGSSRAAVEDARLIRSEVERCREILARLGSESGEAAGDVARTLTTEEWLRECLRRLVDDARVQAEVAPATAGMEVRAPISAVGQALRNLVSNALEASAPDGIVTVTVELADGAIVARVIDDGPGMTADVLGRATEPFFTTKSAGGGMGLGLFLASGVAERLGGSLDLESEVGRGTVALMRLPILEPSR